MLKPFVKVPLWFCIYLLASIGPFFAFFATFLTKSTLHICVNNWFFFASRTIGRSIIDVLWNDENFNMRKLKYHAFLGSNYEAGNYFAWALLPLNQSLIFFYVPRHFYLGFFRMGKLMVMFFFVACWTFSSGRTIRDVKIGLWLLFFLFSNQICFVKGMWQKTELL